MTLVAGIDSSTQSCKVLVCDADTGAVVRSGRARHPDGSEIDPAHWWTALQEAIQDAGGLDDVAAVSVGGQQHGMVCLDAAGEVVRPALLWNDTRSAPQAEALIRERGADFWATEIGAVPVASLTITKLRWLAENEPDHLARTAAVCLPHDWLTWRLSGSTSLDTLVTDRSDASGTGYWSTTHGRYDRELLADALGGRDLQLPRVLAPHEQAGRMPSGAVLGPGAGDNAAAALGVGAGAGDAVLSLGTSGVVTAVGSRPAIDPTGVIAGFADATGHYLPLVCTLNAARVLDAAARLLGVDHDGLARLAEQAPPGADGLVLVPYLDGERTPDLPEATGSLMGLTATTMSPAHVARASVEGMLCSQRGGLEAVRTVAEVERVVLIGGAAASSAVRTCLPTVSDLPVDALAPAEYVALGAARQAAWVLSGDEAPPTWAGPAAQRLSGELVPDVWERYRNAREHVLTRSS